MDRRIVVFIGLALVILTISFWLEDMRRKQWIAQQAANPPAAKENGAKDGKKPADGNKPAQPNGADNKKPGEKKPPDQGANQANQKPNPAGPAPAEEEKQIGSQWWMLGNVASTETTDNPYEMLVTFTSRGAAVERIEFSNPRYGDLENRSGYLGQLAVTPAEKGKTGCQVNVVGRGTPADAAGMKPEDLITALAGQKIASPQDFVDALSDTKPGQTIELTVRRGDNPLKLTATLGRYPLSVIRPEFKTDAIDLVAPKQGEHDPLSFLLTLTQADDDKLDPANLKDEVNDELDGLHRRDGEWEGRKIDDDTVEFSRLLPKWELKLVKRYKLARREKDKDAPAYHLTLTVEIQNVSTTKAHRVAYQLDGPTGLPTEGWWYAQRVSREWGGIALRDVALKFRGNSPEMVKCRTLADNRATAIEAKKAGNPPDKKEPIGVFQPQAGAPLVYAGVDAQYFASALVPQRGKEALQQDLDKNAKPWLADIRAIVLGEVPTPAYRQKVDVTCRLTSAMEELAPKGKLTHEYDVFVGPKRPQLLEQYGDGPNENLGDLVYYGWFGWVARPMVAVLDVFHLLLGNYGLSILLLTVLVRLCMFPLSRKQALSARKMQELQPEMKRINEKYKGNAEQRTKATQELWRKHNYNPLGGCGLVFIQMPIFMGLYRSLSVNVDLRQAPLLGSAVRWCSNLAAPDMLWHWEGVLPDFITTKTSSLALGPYLNILPLFTVGLFLWQQTLFMPPAADKEAAFQQKMMKGMTLFMGLMFFKVASGLCLYFIASSLWGIAERKLLPKAAAAPGGMTPATRAPVPPSSSNGSSAAERRKQRGKNRG